MWREMSIWEKILAIVIPVLILILLLPMSCWGWDTFQVEEPPPLAERTEPWTKANKILLGTALTFQLGDYLTSIDAAGRRNEGYYELNPLLPEDATKRDYDEYFLFMTGAGVLLANEMKPKLRNWFLGLWTVLEIAVVYMNMERGLEP